MESIKSKLMKMLSNNVCISVNDRLIDNSATIQNLPIKDESEYMLDYIWDDNGNFLRLDYRIFSDDSDK